MSNVREPEKSRKTEIWTWSSVWSSPPIASLVSAIGLSGLLLAIGFMILRSHYSLWGIWSGVTYEPAELIAEGGRFLFHLFLVVLDLLDPISSDSPVWFYVLLIGSFTLLNIKRNWINSRLKLADNVGKLPISVLPLIFSGITFYLGWHLSRLIASIIAPGDILNNTSVPNFLEKSLQTPEASYFEIIRQIIILGVLIAIVTRLLQLKQNTVALLLAMVSTVFLLAAVSLLPAVYGRLIQVPLYPTISFSSDPASICDRFLIRSNATQWIVWNAHDGRTEVIRPKESEIVHIGPKKKLIRENKSNESTKEQSCDAK